MASRTDNTQHAGQLALVVGGGQLGVHLAVALERAGFDVGLVGESRRAFDGMPAESRARLTVGDPVDPHLLRRTGAHEATLLVASTGRDERNVAIALIAGRLLGTRLVVACVEVPCHVAACRRLGIEAVSAHGPVVDAFLDCVHTLLQ